mmetsp:Transcript_17185/g.17043  ORF Transcript_17185/g.17043 Transcript_17185/m.17043 type:complete len:231 (-) Transcript_17185:11-703(-)
MRLASFAIGATTGSSTSNDRHHSTDMDTNVVVVPPLPLIDAARMLILDVVQSMSMEFTFALVFVASFLASRYLRAQSIPSGPVSDFPLSTPSEQSSAKPSPLPTPIHIQPTVDAAESPPPGVIKGVVRVLPLTPVAEEDDDSTSKPLERVKAITELTGSRYSAAVLAYSKLKDSGDLANLLVESSLHPSGRESVTEMYNSLALAAVRVGPKATTVTFDVRRCLRDMTDVG